MLGLLACASQPSYTGGTNRRIVVQASLGKNMRPYSKIITAKRAQALGQVAECLPTKWEALRFKTPVSKKEKKKRN
jgi:hypothetical protein